MEFLVALGYIITFAAVGVVILGVLMLFAISIKPDFLQRKPRGSRQ